MKVNSLGTNAVDLKNSDSVNAWIEYNGKCGFFLSTQDSIEVQH